MEIYAPIAGLLGIWRLKWQMEDICFKYIHPEEYKELEYKYEVEKKAERNQYTQKIKNILGAKLKEAGINYKIETRFKHLYSIFLKMQRKDRKFDEIYDVFALRVIVPSVTDCYKALGVIHALWKPMPDRIKDYIAMPKPNGYRSLHTTVLGPDNKATEFQIRTQEMHEESLYGIAAHWYYKQKSGSSWRDLKQPNWVKEIMEKQRQAANSSEFINSLKIDVFHNRIFVFTPKGDVFDLPENSTPIDLAFAVHTEIGNKASGCLVNNKMSQLSQPLKNGDMVEIIIDNKRKGPSLDWLEFVQTQRARDKIKHFAQSSRLEQIKKMINVKKLYGK
jgi:GTP pyrophosphokinase